MRSSNIELLRILSMVLIVMHHFSVHGAWPDGGALASDFAVNILSFGGKLGVNCFVLITGYFSVCGKPKISSVLRVVLETWFYSYAILAIFLVAQPDLVAGERLRKALIPLCSGEYWFVTCYVGMMLASPFLNALYRQLGDRAKSYFMALGFIVLSIVPTLTTFNPIGSNLVWFFYLYLLGGWVRELHDKRETGGHISRCLFDPLRVIHKLKPAGTGSFFVGVIFVWASMAVILWSHRHLGFDFIGPRYFIAQHAIPTFIASLGLLVAFSRLKVPSLRFVNTVAKSTLGVYLIHDNPFVRAWLWPYFAGIYALGPIAILASGVFSAIVVFAICSLIDGARIALLEEPLFTAIKKHWGPRLDKTQAVVSSIARGDC